MISITRVFTIDAGHRVHNHEGKCKNLHGHTYKVELTVSANELDDLGRVIDFSVLKSVFGEYLDRTYDHTMLLHGADPIWKHREELSNGKLWFRMPPLFGNPTAENLAKLFYVDAHVLLQEHGISVVGVKVWETPNCFAEFVMDASETALVDYIQNNVIPAMKKENSKVSPSHQIRSLYCYINSQPQDGKVGSSIGNGLPPTKEYLQLLRELKHTAVTEGTVTVSRETVDNSSHSGCVITIVHMGKPDQQGANGGGGGQGGAASHGQYADAKPKE